MPRTLPPDVARRLLARAQRLAAPDREDGAAVPDVVRAVAGLQAQDAPAAALGIRARRAGSSLAEIDRARFEERSIVRAWVMRGTLHLIPAEDARWMLALLGPVGLARGRRRRAELGVNSDEAVAAVCAALEDGPRTRHEIAEAVRSAGVRVEDHPQVPVHLVACAAQAGRVIEAGPEPTYALIDDWLGPPGPAPDDPLAELARRHAHAHPPSAPEDFAAWSGLGIRDARRAYAELDLEEVEVLGRRAWVPRGLDPAPPHVRLLPRFDSYLLGHRDRALILRPEHDLAVRPGGGILAATLMVNGRIEGTWKLDCGRPKVTAFGDFDYAAEVEDVVRFRATEP